MRIGSTVGYNLSEDGGIAVIIVVDEPTSSVKYGSVVAAPYVSAFLADALPYLGYESEYEANTISLPSFVGDKVSEAKAELEKLKISYEVIGSGDTVLSQTPNASYEIFPSMTKVILYTSEESEYITVPTLVGKELSLAVKEATDIGLNIKITGTDSGNVIYQSLPYGASVKRGSVIELRAIITDYED